MLEVDYCYSWWFQKITAHKLFAISGNGMLTITYSTFMIVMTSIVTFFYCHPV